MERRLHASKAASKCGASDLGALCDKNKYQLGYRQNTLYQCDKTKYLLGLRHITLFQCDKTKYLLGYRQITLFQWDKTKYQTNHDFPL